MQTSKHSYAIQKRYEETFGKKGIHDKAVADLKATECLIPIVQSTVKSLNTWIHTDHWESKNQRLQCLVDLDLEELVYSLTAVICLECIKPMKLVSVASMCAKHLGMSNKIEAIQTVAEILSILGDQDLCDITIGQENTRWVHIRYELDAAVLQYKFDAMYLPPMIIKPRVLRHNRSSGYITQQGESLILGFYENHHDEDICLDVLNILNANEYCLDEAVIAHCSDSWTQEELTSEEFNELSHQDKLIYSMSQEQWEIHQEQSYKIKTLMLYHNNSFYLQNKVDKRGRIYTSGYHISTQGNGFKKAAINLKKKEICTGLEDWQ